MTPTQSRQFENRKYHAMILVKLDHGDFVLCGPDRQPIACGELLTLLPHIYRWEPPAREAPEARRARATAALEGLKL